MKRLLGIGLGACAFLAGAAGAGPPALLLPQLPQPALVENDFGEVKRIGFLHFLHELQNSGVQGLDDVDFVDENYAMLRSDSLPMLAAWLETACHDVGVELQQARRHDYDGMTYAQLLEVAASLAEAKQAHEHLSMPIGVLLCKRRQPWGELPGDGARDAYMLIATERGLLLYDPPTRQLCPLADFPNNADVFKIQF